MGTTLDPRQDGDKAFGDRTRRMVAKVLRQGPRTLAGLEPALRRKEGSYRGSVLRLVEWGVVVEAAGSTPDRVIYGFNPAWSDALSAAVRRYALGELSKDAQLILVPTEDLVSAGSVVAAFEGRDRPLWAARFSDSNFGLMLAFDAEVDEHACLRVYSALRKAGIGCALVHVQRLLDEQEVPAYFAALAGHDVPSLPAGNEAA